MNKIIRIALWALLSIAYVSTAPASATCLNRQPPTATPSGTFSPLLFGAPLRANRATDDVRSRPAFLKSLESIPINNFRFPGGNYGDNYFWREQKPARSDWQPNNYRASANDLSFDELIAVARCVGAQLTIVLNLKTWVARGDIEGGIREAEDWVRYANVQKGFGIRYWELGNELYTEGKQRELRLSGDDYGRYYAMYRRRLKAVDPSIRLGLAVPTRLARVARGDVGPWWDEAIRGANGDVDYVIIHNYAPRSMQRLVYGGSGMDALLRRIHNKMRASLGHLVPVHVTEWNAGVHLNPKPGGIEFDSIGHALYVADALLDLAEGEVRLATYWPLLRGKQGLLDPHTLAVNAVGKAMKLLTPLAGWRIERRQSISPAGLQVSLLSSPGRRQGAVVALNWSTRETQVDWKAMIGGCAATVEALEPSASVSKPDDLVDALQQDATRSVKGPYHLAGYSVALIRTTQDAGCN